MTDRMVQPTDQVTRLREQRDRFIAFAFAGAEVLMELDSEYRITYSAGTAEHLLGVSSDRLTGLQIDALVAPGDRATLQELMRRIQNAGRMERTRLHFLRKNEPFRGILSGITFPERPGTTFLTLSRAQRGDYTGRDGGGNRGDQSPTTIPEPIPQNGDEFARLAARRLEDAERFGEDVRMTLIDFDGASIKDRLDPEAVGQFIEGVESYLRAWSVGGNSVGVLENGKYGVIHDKNLEAEQVTSRISEIAALFDPAGEGIKVNASTLDLNNDSLTPEDISKALVYTINRFVEEGGEDFAIRSIKDSYTEAINETLAKVNAFRQTLTSDNFVLVLQPIVDLKGWGVHHYEALARMVQGDKLFLPARFIGFAEEFGVVNEFDLMVVRKSIFMLKESRKLQPRASVAVNLSGKSLSNDGFVQQLLLMLAENRDILPRLMFEVTESAELKDLEAANRIIQKIRSFGCKISIDDFGAGAAAFQYLKALQVDFVKIDGSYIRDAFNTRYGIPFLKAMAQLATDMGIQSIGEMVEDARTMWLLNDVGVHYGQGYFFGRPMPDVFNFRLSPLPDRSGLERSLVNR